MFQESKTSFLFYPWCKAPTHPQTSPLLIPRRYYHNAMNHPRFAWSFEPTCSNSAIACESTPCRNPLLSNSNFLLAVWTTLKILRYLVKKQFVRMRKYSILPILLFMLFLHTTLYFNGELSSIYPFFGYMNNIQCKATIVTAYYKMKSKHSLSRNCSISK